MIRYNVTVKRQALATVSGRSRCLGWRVGSGSGGDPAAALLELPLLHRPAMPIGHGVAAQLIVAFPGDLTRTKPMTHEHVFIG